MEGPVASLRSATTADQVSVRRHNLALVLDHLSKNGPRSRAQVASETGLNKATVSSLVADLVGRGLVREGETQRGSMGRPGQYIDLDDTAYFAIGTEVNIDYISTVVMNMRGEIISERRVALDTVTMTPRQVLRRVVQMVTTAMRPLQARQARPLGLSLAVPGIVEAATGMVFDAVNLGWREVPVRQEVSRMLRDPDFPIHLDNEANLSALAELESRGAQAPKELLLLTGGVGVGGGIVSKGEVMRGSRGFAGEIGHMQVDRGGSRCACGRVGCWETVAGLGALLTLAADPDDHVRNPEVDLVHRLDELRRRAELGDQRTLNAIAAIGDWLVSGVGTLVNIFNPEVLVLGGYFAALSPWMSSAVEAGLEQNVHAPEAGGCRVEISTLGFSAAVRGGAHHAIRAVLDDPAVVPTFAASTTSGATGS